MSERQTTWADEYNAGLGHIGSKSLRTSNCRVGSAGHQNSANDDRFREDLDTLDRSQLSLKQEVVSLHQRQPNIDLEKAADKIDLEKTAGKRKWGRFTLRDWEDDEPQDWWFASIAVPLLAATIGPLANVLSIAALVVYWRQCVSSIADSSNAENCPWDGDLANIMPDLLGLPYHDPDWCYKANVVSLTLGLIGNFFLLFNFTRRIRYIIALPVTIIMWLLASAILIGITILIAVSEPPTAPQQIYSQGYWYAIMAAILYFTCSMLLLVNMIGYFLGHYPQNFSLTDAQRTLILQTMMFFIWLAGGAGIFSALELRDDSGASDIPLNFIYTNALYFCDVTILTIGFGDMYPTSDAARGLLFPYAIGGIVSLGLMVSSLTKFAGEIGSENIVYRHIERSRARTVGRTVTSSLEIHRANTLIDCSSRSKLDALQNSVNTQTNPSEAIVQLDSTEPERTVQFDSTEPNRTLLRRVTTFPSIQRVATLVKPKTKLILLREEKDRFEAMRRIQADTKQFKRYYALGMAIIAFGLLWCVGAVVFWQSEKRLQGMTYFQALYFCYVSLLTIGFGDLAPKSNPGRAFFVVWSLIAIPTITLLVSYLGDTIINNFKQVTNAVADFTVLPKEGIWHGFIARHPNLRSWLHRRSKSNAISEESRSEPSTIAQLAVESLSHHELARKLTKAIQQTARDAKNHPHKQYGYEDWVEFTRLIRFTAKTDLDLDENGMIEWDWIGEDSPMMAKSSEAEFVLERLCESMHRYVNHSSRVASITV